MPPAVRSVRAGQPAPAPPHTTANSNPTLPLHPHPPAQALKANLTKHLKAVDEAKEGGDGASGAKGLRKKEQRLANWRTEAGKQMAKYNTQAGLVVSGLVHLHLITTMLPSVG